MSDVIVSPVLLARRIQTVIHSAKIDVTTEAAAVAAIRSSLSVAEIPFGAEVPLSKGERIDLLCDRVGVEVKVGHSKRAIYAQLRRYAACDQIGALVLATGRSFPRSVSEVDGVPLLVCDLTRGWL